VLVQGNHDAQNVITRELRLPEHVTKLSAQAPESVLFEDLGVVVHGQSFKSRAVTDNLALDYPPPVEHLFNIGLLHCNVGAVAGHDNYAPCTCDQLASHGYQYWALGHVHNRAVLHENPWVVYPGNLQARHIRETGKKGAYLVQVEDGDLVHMAFRPLDVVRWEHLIVDASHMTDRDELLNAIQSAVASANSDADGLPLIVRVTLTGATELHNGLTADLATWEEEIREWVAQMGQVWTEKVKIKTSACDSSAGSILDPEFLGALKERLNALAQDDDAIAQLSQSVSALSQKTAQHLETRASDSGYMRELLGRVGGILEGRLGAQWAGDE
jgi:DNA repair exonuclease SbcCD nuclease subunit